MVRAYSRSAFKQNATKRKAKANTTGKALRDNVTPRPLKRVETAGKVAQPSPATGQAEDEYKNIGILVVHGIGNRRSGRHLKSVVDALNREYAGASGARSMPPSPYPQGDISISTDSTPTLLIDNTMFHFVDGFWGDLISLRKTTLPAIIWVVKVLPAVLLLFAPDHRDRKVLLSQPQDGSISNHDVNLMVLRFVTRLFTAGILILVVCSMPSTLGYVASVLITVSIVTVLFRIGLIQDLFAAGAGEGQLSSIVAALREKAAVLRNETDELILVGHSQGGFLSYLVAKWLLSNDATSSSAKQLSLIGVSSGLKPIWLVRLLQTRKIARAAWTLLISEILIIAGIIYFDSDFVNAILQYLSQFLRQIILYLTVAQGAPFQDQVPNNILDIIRGNIWPLSIGLLRIFIGTILVFAIAYLGSRLIRSLISNIKIEVPNLRNAKLWWEVSSHHDPVGRMLYPVLPSATERLWWPVVGSPILDHIRVNRNRSIFAREFALLLKILARPSSEIRLELDAFRHVTVEIAWRFARVRRLGAWATGVSVFLLMLIQASDGESAVSVLTEYPVQLFLIIVAISCIITALSSRIRTKYAQRSRSNMPGLAESAGYTKRWLESDNDVRRRTLLGIAVISCTLAGLGFNTFGLTLFPWWSFIVIGVLIASGFAVRWYVLLLITVPFVWTFFATPGIPARTADVPEIWTKWALVGTIQIVTICLLAASYLFRDTARRRNAAAPE